MAKADVPLIEKYYQLRQIMASWRSPKYKTPRP